MLGSLLELTNGFRPKLVTLNYSCSLHHLRENKTTPSRRSRCWIRPHGDDRHDVGDLSCLVFMTVQSKLLQRSTGADSSDITRGDLSDLPQLLWICVSGFTHFTPAEVATPGDTRRWKITRAPLESNRRCHVCLKVTLCPRICWITTR